MTQVFATRAAGALLRSIWSAAVLAAFAVSGAAQAQVAPQASATATQLAPVDKTGALVLIRTTLLALAQANETGNYTVLRDLSAPSFRDINTAARLSEIFAPQRAQNLDLSPVAVVEPQLTLAPQIESNGLMRIAGFFPATPNPVNFDLRFAAIDGRWKVLVLSVTIAPVAAAQSPGQPDQKRALSSAPKR